MQSVTVLPTASQSQHPSKSMPRSVHRVALLPTRVMRDPIEPQKPPPPILTTLQFSMRPSRHLVRAFVSAPSALASPPQNEMPCVYPVIPSHPLADQLRQYRKTHNVLSPGTAAAGPLHSLTYI